jgi:hypothetical protein
MNFEASHHGRQTAHREHASPMREDEIVAKLKKAADIGGGRRTIGQTQKFLFRVDFSLF